MKKMQKKYWLDIPPWFILGALIIMVPIFLFWALDNIHRQKEGMVRLLLEKGAALIRSFEAGTRTGMMGMMGMHGGRFQLQRLLMETAQQPDIVYIIVTDTRGVIRAHSESVRIGKTYGRDLDLSRIAQSKKILWRQVSNPDGSETFEVFRRFSPSAEKVGGFRGRMMSEMLNNPFFKSGIIGPGSELLIFIGLDMAPIEAARKEDMRHTVIMALVLLLIGFAGIFSLFIAQAYHSTRTSLTRIKAFSDNLVEKMPIGLLAMGPDERIASFNQTAESIFEISSAAVLGKNVNDILPPQLSSFIRELKDRKEIIEKEIDCFIDHGKIIPLGASGSSLEGEDGTFLGFIILFRDLTEVRGLQREVERNQRLASLGRLAAGIAHEIRNPLSSIKGFATYFGERYKDNPEDKNIAQIMVNEVERLNRVIGQLLEFARPMTVKKKPVNINTLIQHALKMIERDAQKKNIKINLNPNEPLPQVPIDPDRINQVLLNVLLNGVEAMENGGDLTVDISRDEARGIKIFIRDSGKGISKEDLNHIFDPYFTTRPSGTGLGLAIVHKIIESHGGEVQVESKEGNGTTVIICLPFK